MKNFKKGIMVLLAAGLFSFYSCGPNDDSGSQDSNFSNGEGEIDSSRLLMSDSTEVSIKVPYFVKPLTGINKNQGS